MTIMEKIEKLLTGYTAAERADIQRRYIDLRIEQHLVAAFGGLDADKDHEEWMREVREREAAAESEG